MSVETLLCYGQEYISYSEIYVTISTQHIFEEHIILYLRQIISYLTFSDKPLQHQGNIFLVFKLWMYLGPEQNFSYNAD